MWAMNAKAVLLAAFALFTLISCTQGALVRGRADGLAKVVDDAEQNGAVRCAPRELALAKSHLRFAQTELDQGQLSNAENHLAIAEPNAKAALDVSLPDKCAGREVTPGDRDGDGIPDVTDKCPDEPEN